MKKCEPSRRLRRRARRHASCRTYRTKMIIRYSKGVERSNNDSRRKSKIKKRPVKDVIKRSKSLLTVIGTSVIKRWQLLKRCVARRR